MSTEGAEEAFTCLPLPDKSSSEVVGTALYPYIRNNFLSNLLWIQRCQGILHVERQLISEDAPLWKI